MPRSRSYQPLGPSSTATSPRWFELVFAISNSDTDLVTGIFAAADHTSCELREAADDRTDLVLYVQAGSETEAQQTARGLAERAPAGACIAAAVRPVAEEAWKENWKRFFPSLEIGRRLIVLPPWLASAERDVGSRTSVVIHPGMAFGTGHHATTAACLEALDALVEPGMSVADVGCGSGILAIAALRLGAARAVATDDDPAAIDAVRANAERNGVADRLTTLLQSGPPTGAACGTDGFDLAVANIHTQVLRASRESLTSCVKPGGYLVLSGIEAESRSLIEGSFAGAEWPLLKVVEARDWVTVTLRRARKQPPTENAS